MSSKLASPRFRRRVRWCVLVSTIGGGVVLGAVLVGNTGREETATPLTSTPAWVYREPRAHHVSATELRELEGTTSLFIRTAVARHNLDRAWELAAPSLRGGMSRDDWTSGDNTVVPFPAQRITAWNVDYSYENDVAFDVSLVSKPPYDTIGKTFMIELTRPPHSKKWFVAYWAPKGVSSLEVSRSYRKQTPPPADVRAPLSPRWLLLPGGVFAAVLALLGLVAVRSTLRGRRAARRYAADLGAYRSSSRPS